MHVVVTMADRLGDIEQASTDGVVGGRYTLSYYPIHTANEPFVECDPIEKTVEVVTFDSERYDLDGGVQEFLVKDEDRKGSHCLLLVRRSFHKSGMQRWGSVQGYGYSESNIHRRGRRLSRENCCVDLEPIEPEVRTDGGEATRTFEFEVTADQASDLYMAMTVWQNKLREFDYDCTDARMRTLSEAKSGLFEIESDLRGWDDIGTDSDSRVMTDGGQDVPVCIYCDHPAPGHEGNGEPVCHICRDADRLVNPDGGRIELPESARERMWATFKEFETEYREDIGEVKYEDDDVIVVSDHHGHELSEWADALDMDRGAFASTMHAWASEYIEDAHLAFSVYDPVVFEKPEVRTDGGRSDVSEEIDKMTVLIRGTELGSWATADSDSISSTEYDDTLAAVERRRKENASWLVPLPGDEGDEGEPQ